MSWKRADVVSVVLIAAGTAFALWSVPGPDWKTPLAPESSGVYGYLLTLALLAAFRWAGKPTLERIWLTIFLVSMPLIYLQAAFREGTPLALELGGLALFSALAFLGWRRSPWFMAWGILGHGLWDLSHWHRPGTVADWYTLACAVIDLAVGVYALQRVRSGAFDSD